MDNLIFWSPKRRVRYRHPRLFLTMYAILGEFLGPRKGGLGTDTLHDSRKCTLFWGFRCRRFASDVASAESHRALGPFAFQRFFCFSQLFCFVYHRQSQFWGFRCLRLANDVASAKSHRALGPFAILMVFKIFAIVFCFAYHRQSQFFGPKKEGLI